MGFWQDIGKLSDMQDSPEYNPSQVYDAGDEYVDVVADKNPDYLGSLLDGIYGFANTAQDAWNKTPYALQALGGMVAGDLLAKGMLNSPVGKSGVNVGYNILKGSGILPTVGKAVMNVANSPSYKAVRSGLGQGGMQTTHYGRALNSAVKDNVIPAIVGAIPETSLYLQDGADKAAGDWGVLSTSKLLSDGVSKWKKPLVQYLEDETQDRLGLNKP